MEQERTLERMDVAGGAAVAVCDPGVEQARDALEGILAEADRILDGLRPVRAEEYLQQNRQRGGQ